MNLPPQLPSATSYPGFNAAMPVHSHPFTPARPRAVTVLSVIAIVFSSISILCLPFALISDFNRTAIDSLIIRIMHDDPIMTCWQIADHLIGIAIAGFWLAAGCSSLSLSPVGRWLMIRVNVAQLLMCLTDLGMIIFFLMPPLMGYAHDGDQRDRIAAIAGMIGSFIGVFMGTVLPFVTLYLFQSPKVIEAFEHKVQQQLPPNPYAAAQAWQQPRPAI